MKKPIIKNGSLGVKFNLPNEPELSASLSRVFTNISRVSSLLKTYDFLRATNKDKRGRSNIHTSDILRSCVVLLHATLEDGLRTLLRFKLPRTKEIFDGIALHGLNTSGRPEKFFLGELHRFRGKTIDEIWNESLEAHLSRQSFNDSADLMVSLKHIIGPDTSLVDALLPILSSLIARRHHIVHNADINERNGKRGEQFTRSLQRKQVHDWMDGVISLFILILHIQTKKTEPNCCASKPCPQISQKGCAGYG